MAKQGMKRPRRTHTQPQNDVPPVPELQGKAKHGKTSARPLAAGTGGPNQKVYHTDSAAARNRAEKPISGAYPAIDNDLARDNLENDIPAADLEDL